MTSPVAGLSILLVEDEFLIAIDAEDMLMRELGAGKVSIAGTFEQAQKKIAEEQFDLAILDVNLNGRVSFPLAQALKQRGTPVLFGTGYNLASRPIEGYEDGVCVSKPYTAYTLKKGLVAALGERGAA